MITIPIDLIIVMASILVSSILINQIVQKLVIRLRKRSARNRSVNLRIFLNNTQGYLRLWIILGTVYILGIYYKIDQTSILGLVMKTILAVIIISLLLVLYRATQTIIQYYVRKEKLPNTTIFNTLIAILTIVLGITLVLTSMGVSTAPITAAFGIGALAIALALQPTLSNLFAGISIVASKQINPGDFVELDTSQTGIIEDIRWRTTSIITPKDTLIIIPNSVISNLIVVNHSLPEEDQWIFVMLGVHYASDLSHVKTVCADVVTSVQQTEEGCVRDFEPSVIFNNFGPSSIDLRVAIRINDYAKQFQIRSAFIEQLHSRFKEEGIIIPYPITTVEFANEHLKDKK